MNRYEVQSPTTEACVVALSMVGVPAPDGKPRNVDGDGDPMPAVLDLPAAAALLGVGRTTAYRLVRERLWPTPVVRLGRLIKIPTQPLLDLLHGAWPQPVGAPVALANRAVAGDRGSAVPGG